ncbi:MAG: hypothetical protein ACOX6P_11365 [Candidatus Merdivicinus sp.]|jgi:hypothetical protein
MVKTEIKEKRVPFDPKDAEDLKEVYENLKALPDEQMMYVVGYIRAIHDLDALKQ